MEGGDRLPHPPIHPRCRTQPGWPACHQSRHHSCMPTPPSHQAHGRAEHLHATSRPRQHTATHTTQAVGNASTQPSADYPEANRSHAEAHTNATTRQPRHNATSNTIRRRPPSSSCAPSTHHTVSRPQALPERIGNNASSTTPPATTTLSRAVSFLRTTTTTLS